MLCTATLAVVVQRRPQQQQQQGAAGTRRRSSSSHRGRPVPAAAATTCGSAGLFLGAQVVWCEQRMGEQRVGCAHTRGCVCMCTLGVVNSSGVCCRYMMKGID